MARRFYGFIQELKRRKVAHASGLYLVTAWGASLGAAELLPAFGVPEWAVRALVILFLMGFPVVAVLAWFFDFTAHGIVRDPNDVMSSNARGINAGSAQPLPQSLMETAIAKPSLVTGSLLEVSWTVNGKAERQMFNHQFRLGRDTACEIATLDPIASRHHARVEHRNDQWWVVDLNSRNGTYLDGNRVTNSQVPDRCELQLGDGGQRFQLRLFNSASTTVAVNPRPPAP